MRSFTKPIYYFEEYEVCVSVVARRGRRIKAETATHLSCGKKTS